MTHAYVTVTFAIVLPQMDVFFEIGPYIAKIIVNSRINEADVAAYLRGIAVAKLDMPKFFCSSSDQVGRMTAGFVDERGRGFRG